MPKYGNHIIAERVRRIINMNPTLIRNDMSIDYYNLLVLYSLIYGGTELREDQIKRRARDVRNAIRKEMEI